MPKIEVHNDARPCFTLGEPASGKPEKWAPGEVVPHVAEVPDELVRRYAEIMPGYFEVQQALEALYDSGVPANAVRP